MKLLIAFLLFLFPVYPGLAQTMDFAPAEPEVLELSISTPQPRLKETFQVSIDVYHLRANIFKSIMDKVQLTDDISSSSHGELTMNVSAIQKGKHEIGPLEFYLDKTKYTTNKITYEVIDPLPDTDKGLWFRKVMTSDSTFSIIIEQRIPANTKKTKTSKTSYTITNEPESGEIVKFKDSYSIKGVNGKHSQSSTSFSSTYIGGEVKQFMYGYSVYNFEIVDRKAKIKISRGKFSNMPPDFKFEDILIQ